MTVRQAQFMNVLWIIFPADVNLKIKSDVNLKPITLKSCDMRSENISNEVKL